jgi:hypothetical protein
MVSFSCVSSQLLFFICLRLRPVPLRLNWPMLLSFFRQSCDETAPSSAVRAFSPLPRSTAPAFAALQPCKPETRLRNNISLLACFFLSFLQTWLSFLCRTASIRLCLDPDITYPCDSNPEISSDVRPISPRRGIRFPAAM